MTPFYAILRAVPNKFLGLIAMAAAIALMFVLPWLDKSPVRSIRYKGIFSKIAITGLTPHDVTQLNVQPRVPAESRELR